MRLMNLGYMKSALRSVALSNTIKVGLSYLLSLFFIDLKDNISGPIMLF